MSRAPKLFRFETEAAMCAAFITDAERQGWTAYPETAGFDILLVHRKTGLQVGVEAKQRLNTEVVSQAIEHVRQGPTHGPDFHAILVPEGGVDGLSGVLELVGITTIRARGIPNKTGMTYVAAAKYSTRAFSPDLPNDYDLRDPSPQGWWYESTNWAQHCPAKQCKLPDYVPDVIAGDSAPVKLTEWKIRAIKVAVLLERRGVITADDFKALKISMSRWTQSRWIVPVRRGVWKANGGPNFRAQHPVNFDQIAADFETWSAALPKPPPDLFAVENAA